MLHREFIAIANFQLLSLVGLLHVQCNQHIQPYNEILSFLVSLAQEESREARNTVKLPVMLFILKDYIKKHDPKK